MNLAYAYAAALLVLASVVGYLLVRLPLIRRSFLPTALGAGIVLLIAGPQVAGILPEASYEIWSGWPSVLINIVFASLLLAKPMLGLKNMWRLAGPQVAFGQMMAWGQYAWGGLLALVVLIPVFDLPALSGALIEISFEGGHGTVAGMTPVFEEFGFETGQEIAVALATASLLTALVSGIILINWGRRQGHLRPGNLAQISRNKVYNWQIIHQLHKKGIYLRRKFTIWRLLGHSVLIGLGVLIGWLILEVLLLVEGLTWGRQGVEIFSYMPLFTFCMFGGLIAQSLWRRLGFKVSRELVDLISSTALSLLIITAVGTMSLKFIASDGLAFGLLYLTGVVWIVASFILLARRMFSRYWFQNAIVDMGQSMGMTATGLLFAKMTDPKNRTNAVEAFGYKQLLFEPLMGGGLITALSMPIIALIGLPLFTLAAAVLTFGWMAFGLLYFGPGRAGAKSKFR